MNRQTIFRISIDLALAVCVLFGWWYIALPIGAIALFRLPAFAELVAAGFAYDALFGLGLGTSFASAYAGTIASGLLFLFAIAVKKSMR